MANPKLIDMYKDFLSLVRKARVGTVSPEEFTRTLNLAIEEAVNNKLSAMEVNKKVYDELSPLKDSIESAGSLRLIGNKDFKYILHSFDYRRIVAVRIDLSSTIRNVKCHILPSIEKSEVLSGYYSKPSNKKCYYEPVTLGGMQSIKIYVPQSVENVNNMTVYVELYEEPDEVPIADVTNNTKYSQFNKEMSSYIVNIAARMYIESVADPRYQSFLNELQTKINN